MSTEGLVSEEVNEPVLCLTPTEELQETSGTTDEGDKDEEERPKEVEDLIMVDGGPEKPSEGPQAQDLIQVEKMGGEVPQKAPPLPPSNLRPLKITAVGDGLVGKTCLLITYTHKKFPTEYVPTVFDNYSDRITVDEKDYNMVLWDTAGQEDFERLRPLTYPNTDCFLLCYSVGNKASFGNVLSKWYPELKHYCPQTPIILVATKTDLRQNESGQEMLSASDGKRLKKKIHAVKYMECSALQCIGLQEIFIEAVRASTKQGPSTKKRKKLFCL